MLALHTVADRMNSSSSIGPVHIHLSTLGLKKRNSGGCECERGFERCGKRDRGWIALVLSGQVAAEDKRWEIKDERWESAGRTTFMLSARLSSKFSTACQSASRKASIKRRKRSATRGFVIGLYKNTFFFFCFLCIAVHWPFTVISWVQLKIAFLMVYKYGSSLTYFWKKKKHEHRKSMAISYVQRLPQHLFISEHSVCAHTEA